MSDRHAACSRAHRSPHHRAGNQAELQRRPARHAQRAGGRQQQDIAMLLREVAQLRQQGAEPGMAAASQPARRIAAALLTRVVATAPICIWVTPSPLDQPDGQVHRSRQTALASGQLARRRRCAMVEPPAEESAMQNQIPLKFQQRQGQHWPATGTPNGLEHHRRHPVHRHRRSGARARPPGALNTPRCSDNAQTLSYAALNAQMDRVAAALQRDGLQPGDTIAICAASSVRYAALYPRRVAGRRGRRAARALGHPRQLRCHAARRRRASGCSSTAAPPN